MVCYVDCCRMYSVVEGMLLEVASLLAEVPGTKPEELTKCPLVKYNPPGHLIAIVGGEGNKDIYIFSNLHRK